MGDQTDDLAENRRKDKNISSMLQETKQNSTSLSNAPGCFSEGSNSHSRFGRVINLKAFFFSP